MEVLNAPEGASSRKHLVELLSSALIGDLLNERIPDLLIGGSFFDFLDHLQVVFDCEANGAENAQRVVEEGLEGWEGRAGNLVPQVVDALAREVLHLLLVNVVEEGVEGQVPPHGVVEWRAVSHDGHSGALRVGFRAQVNQVERVAFKVDDGRLQVLAFV